MKYGRKQAILKAVILSTAGDRKPEGVGKITRYLSDAFFYLGDGHGERIREGILQQQGMAAGAGNGADAGQVHVSV